MRRYVSVRQIVCLLACIGFASGCSNSQAALLKSAEVCIKSKDEFRALNRALNDYRQLNNSRGVRIIDRSDEHTKSAKYLKYAANSLPESGNTFLWFAAAYKDAAAITVYSTPENEHHVLFNFYRTDDPRLTDLNGRTIDIIKSYHNVRFAQVEWMRQEYQLVCPPLPLEENGRK
jgi:hypothetical protein